MIGIVQKIYSTQKGRRSGQANNFSRKSSSQNMQEKAYLNAGLRNRHNPTSSPDKSQEELEAFYQ